MKQNDLLSNLFDQKSFINERIRRQTKPSQKPVYSPRLITRKKEKKEQPVNPFARRKGGQQTTNSVLRYMSFKRVNNEENLTFLSDDNNMNFSQFQSQQSMFNLHFSRIKSSQIISVVVSDEDFQQTNNKNPKNLFDDIMDSSKQLSMDGSMGSSRRQNRVSERFLEMENLQGQYESKSGLSLETMSQSPNIKQSGKFQQKVSLLMRQNKKLRKRNEQLSIQNKKLMQENDSLKQKLTQFQKEIQKLTDDFNKSQQEAHQQFTTHQLTYVKKINEHQHLIQQLTKELTQLRKSQISFKNRLQQLQDTQEMLQKQCLQKQHYLKSLHEQIEQHRTQIQQKQQYSKCLEDVILELNGKIDQLKGENEELLGILEEKMERIEAFQMERDCLVRNLKYCEIELVENKQKIDMLTIFYNENNKNHQKQQQQKFNPQYQQKYIQKSSQPQLHNHTNLIEQLQKEIASLHAVIDSQKQHNEKLKKQISYKLIELDFFKKNHYQHQKNTLQIATLKDRNKRLTKKLNKVIEDFQHFKEKTTFSQKKATKNSQIKKSSLSNYIEDQPSAISNPTLSTQNKQRTSNRTNIHQAQMLQSQKNHIPQHKNRKFRFDSDDQLSFQLSPQKI